ncbi:MAG: hypothetical protein ACXWLR_11060 [Myxococcales bacterium]
MTSTERILAILAHAKEPLCDDCLSFRADVSRRQTVWQICTALSASGAIDRARRGCGDCGKLKNSSRIAYPA